MTGSRAGRLLVAGALTSVVAAVPGVAQGAVSPHHATVAPAHQGTLRAVGATRPVLRGDAVVLAGAFALAPHRRFVLQHARPGSSHWASVPRSGGTTNAAGRLKVRTTPVRTWRYRVVLPPSRSAPRMVSNTVGVEVTRGWRVLASEASHNCAIKDDLSLWCWGWNYGGELGTALNAGTSNPNPHLQQVLLEVGSQTAWRSVAVGENHSCGIRRGGSLWCWGLNYSGQLATPTGTGTTTDNPVPVRVVATGRAHRWRQVDAGARHTCAIDHRGRLWCWGDNQFGQLGNSELGFPNPTPTKVRRPTGSDGWRHVTAGTFHTCATTVEHSLWCWGDNYRGQLGVPTHAGANVPTPTPSRVRPPRDHEVWRSVGAGYQHTCGILSDASLWCWGENYQGQLGTSAGLGETTPMFEPVRVPAPGPRSTWRLVAPAVYHTCALLMDRSLYCWGNNTLGQTGSPIISPDFQTGDPEPRQVFATGSRQTWTSVGGALHTCALRTDHSVWCWGSNELGQLGTTRNSGTQNANPTPVKVALPHP